MEFSRFRDGNYHNGALIRVERVSLKWNSLDFEMETHQRQTHQSQACGLEMEFSRFRDGNYPVSVWSPVWCSSLKRIFLDFEMETMFDSRSPCSSLSLK